MSTHLQTPNDLQNVTETESLSLAALVSELQSQKSIPARARINDWLERAVLSDEDLAPYIGFKEGNYWRHRVCRNEFVEMLVLCWKPGHRTPIHDHNGSHGSVRVHEGRMWETIFHYDEVEGLQYQSARDYAPGAITGSDVPDIHQLGNPDVSEQNLITIHVYAPPLGVLHTYKPGSTKIDLYTPEDIAG